MASIYDLNQPPRPFWDFIANFENHPFFASSRPPAYGAQEDGNNSNGPSGEESSPQGGARPMEGGSRNSAPVPSSDHHREQENPRGGGGHGLRGGWGGRWRHSPFGQMHGRHGSGPRHFHHGPHRGFRRGRYHRHQCCDDSNLATAFELMSGLDLPAFMDRLSEQLGISLDQIWRHVQPQPDADNPSEQVDFVPSVDIFDTATRYIVQVSLPGAKKQDISVDYDADECVLRLAGVVYRPGMNEELHQALVIAERTRQVGVFEREVRLGTREEPAHVMVDDITAKLEDGILTVSLPKVVEDAGLKNKKKVFVSDPHGSEEKSHYDHGADNQEKCVDQPRSEDDDMQLDSEIEKGSSGASTPHALKEPACDPEGTNDEEDNREYVRVDVQ